MSSVPTFDTPISLLCVDKEWTAQFCAAGPGSEEPDCNEDYYEAMGLDTTTTVVFSCGGGQEIDEHTFEGFDPDPYCFSVAHHEDLTFTCKVEENLGTAFEVESDCPELEVVPYGDLEDPVSVASTTNCTLINNHFDPEVPAVDGYGLGIMAALVVAVGLFAIRKIM